MSEPPIKSRVKEQDSRQLTGYGVIPLSEEEKINSRTQYVAIVEGEYICSVNNSLQTRPYRQAFRLDGAYRPLARIKKYLLIPRLKARYPDFVAYNTHELVALYDPEDPESYVGIPVCWMSDVQLRRYVQDRQIPVPLDLIAKLQDRRDLVEEYERCKRENDMAAYDKYFAKIKEGLDRKLSVAQDGFDDEAALREFERSKLFSAGKRPGKGAAGVTGKDEKTAADSGGAEKSEDLF